MSLQSLLTKLITFATLLVWELLPKFIPQLLLFQDSVYLCWNNTNIKKGNTERTDQETENHTSSKWLVLWRMLAKS